MAEKRQVSTGITVSRELDVTDTTPSENVQNESKPAPDASYWNEVLKRSKALSATLDSAVLKARREFTYLVFDWMYGTGDLPKDYVFFCALCELAWQWKFDRECEMHTSADEALKQIQEIVAAMRELI